MKKLFLIAFALLSTLCCYAQKSSAVKFGLTAGITTSVFNKQLAGFGQGSNSALAGYGKYPRFSLQAGVTADYSITPAFSVGSELVYSGRGSAYRIKNSDVILTNNYGRQQDAYDYIKFRINYLELPLLAKYNLSSPKRRTASVIYGGVAPAITVGKSLRYTYYDLNGPSYNVPIKNQDEEMQDVRSFNMSGIVGIQIGAATTQRGFYLDIRLQNTFLSAYNSDASTFWNNTKMFTGMLGMGFRF